MRLGLPLACCLLAGCVSSPAATDEGPCRYLGHVVTEPAVLVHVTFDPTDETYRPPSVLVDVRRGGDVIDSEATDERLCARLLLDGGGLHRLEVKEYTGEQCAWIGEREVEVLEAGVVDAELWRDHRCPS